MPLAGRPGYARPANVARVLKILFHDVIDRDVELRPVGMIHRDGNPFEGVPLDGDDNACVDFRFCPDPRMRWWFDHHPTAFQPPPLREVFEREHRPTRSEEHTSELQSRGLISYAVFC